MHACGGLDVGMHHTRGSESKDGIPYIPSLESMPASSDTEDSNGTNCYSKISTININRENILLRSENKLFKRKERLRNSIKNVEKDGHQQFSNISKCLKQSAVPKLKINSKHGQNKNISDSFRISESEFSDILLERSNAFLLNEKDNTFEIETLQSSLRGGGITYTMAYSKYEKNCEKDTATESAREVINKNNVADYILQKDHEIPCTNIKFTSEIKSETSDGFTINEHIQNNKGNFGNKILKLSLCLFDCNKYPLTNGEGNILENANGQSLVLLKDGQPYWDYLKRLVFDKNCEPSNSPNFQPLNIPYKSNFRFTKIPIYDFRGYPLVDSDGTVLLNADGRSLIQADSNGDVLFDINENPVFDQNGIPLSMKDNCWLNPKGTPYRVFDKLGYPLTNKQGMAMTRRDTTELLRCDDYGRPIFDYNGDLVCDASGYTPTHPRFNPEISDDHENDNITVVLDNVPVKIYDRQDFPLTDIDGCVLKDALGKHLLNIDYSDEKKHRHYNYEYYKKNQVKDDSSCTTDSSKIITVKHVRNEAYKRIFNKDTQKPMKDNNGEFVYDLERRQLYFDMDTHYYTDISRAKAKSDNFPTFSTISENSRVGEEYGSSSADEDINCNYGNEKDIFGRPLRDKYGTPLFDKYGRPIYDLYGMPLYDSKGLPIIAARTDYSIKDTTEQHFNIKRRHADIFRGPLCDSKGEPLYNKYGKPLKDAFGRPLYDEEGLALCNEKGLPSSEAVKKRSLKIVDVEDNFQRLAVSLPQRVQGKICIQR